MFWSEKIKGISYGFDEQNGFSICFSQQKIN